MSETTVSVPDQIHVILRGPTWAGVGRDRVVRASVDPITDHEFKSDWDGVMASTQWGERSDVLSPSARIKTMAGQGVTFGECANGYDVGAWWPDGKPHGGAFNGRESWTWTGEEWDYLRAYLMLGK